MPLDLYDILHTNECRAYERKFKHCIIPHNIAEINEEFILGDCYGNFYSIYELTYADALNLLSQSIKTNQNLLLEKVKDKKIEYNKTEEWLYSIKSINMGLITGLMLAHEDEEYHIKFNCRIIFDMCINEPCLINDNDQCSYFLGGLIYDELFKLISQSIKTNQNLLLEKVKDKKVTYNNDPSILY